MKSPLITMTAITGKPDKAEIFNYMNSLRENGIEQAMLYPRSGCELEYLSEEWFETIGNFLNTARQLNMNIWLYDEFNWPSGDAGGRVTAFEEFRLKAITIKGENKGAISFHSTHNASLFGEKFFPNLLSEAAVNYFIECTHEQYYQKFSEHFGTTIKGFFTDEPSIGYCCTNTSIPYYDEIGLDYQARYGQNFTEDMLSSAPDFCRNAMALIAEQFYRCYTHKLTNWCEEHGILMTGHFLADDAPFGATQHSGDFLKNLSALSLPGIDDIYTDFSKKAFTDGEKFCLYSGIEYAGRRNGAMAELFALGPCDLSYTTKLCSLFLAACFKINHYFLAVSHMDMRGNKKITDYFNNFTNDQPNFKGTVLLAEAAKTAAQYAAKDFTPDIYLRYPTALCASHITDHLDMSRFTAAINCLAQHHIQWKFAAENDSCGNIPVIACNEDGTLCDMDRILETLPSRISVTASDGTNAPGIFVRLFDDGTFIAINLYEKPGFYCINGQSVKLEQHSVFVSTIPQTLYTGLPKERIAAPFRLHYDNNNMIRAMYVNSQTRFEIDAANDCTVHFAVRKETTADIDGDKLICTSGEELLSDGLKNLYDVSAPVLLKAGKHILESGNDYKYMPSVFIIGDFSTHPISGEICGLLLGNRKTAYHPGEKFGDFGKVTFSAHVTIPENAVCLEINGTDLYTCVYADDQLLGEKITAPYTFDLTGLDKKHTCLLRIVQSSSIAPIFGDVNYYDKNSKTVQWAGTPLPSETSYGFDELNWILSEN